MEVDSETCFDVVVVGAGVQGSATAYYLTQKAGTKKVLLLEQVIINNFMYFLRSVALQIQTNKKNIATVLTRLNAKKERKKERGKKSIVW